MTKLIDVDYSLLALGLTIRELRETAGMTQAELGERAGYGAGAGVSVSRIENGTTRPTAARLAGIAVALDRTPAQLEAEAASRADGDEDGAGGGRPTNEKIRARIQRIQREIQHRTSTIEKLGSDLDRAHNLARSQFLDPFAIAAQRLIDIRPPVAATGEGDEEEDETASGHQAAARIQLTRTGVAHALSGGAVGAAAGTAVGGATAYGTFTAALYFGTASTGAAISGLSGAAASNAALALLGGGTLASGGAGVAGGTLLLTGLVAGPAAILGILGAGFAIRRSRKQQEQLSADLDAIEAEMDANKRNFDALTDLLPRTTEVFDDIAKIGGLALERWEVRLPSGTSHWHDLPHDLQDRYATLVGVAGAQLAVATIDLQALTSAVGGEREQLISVADEVLTQAHEVVKSLL